MPEALGLAILELVSLATAETVVGAGGWATTTAVSYGGASFLGISAASAVGSAALLGASIAVAYATAPGPTTPQPTDATQTIKQALPPRPFGYGRCRLAGAYMLYEAAPEPTYHGYSFDVIAFHQGRIDGFLFYYLSSDLVINMQNGSVVALEGYFGTGTRYTNSGGGYLVNIETRSGLSTETAYSAVISYLPSMWTSAHRGDGIASAKLACLANSDAEQFLKSYPFGLPKLSAVADLSPIWDPRDPTQSRTDTSTWAVSSNPVLQLIDYLTSGSGYGEARGPDLDYDDIIAPVIDAWMAQADICDEAVSLAASTGSATEPRYSSNGFVFLSTDPADVIGLMLATCDGWLTEKGDGTLALFVGKYYAPTITLTDDHIVAFTADHGVADEELVNEIRFQYTPPGNDYREATGTPWQDTTSIAEAGRIRSQSVAMKWVQSHTQGRRLAKRAMGRFQATVRGTLSTTLYGLQALGQRFIRVQSDALDDLSDAVIEITSAHIDIANARVSFDWVLVNPNAIDAWDYATEEGTLPTFASKLTPTPGTVTPTKVGSTISAAFTVPDLRNPTTPFGGGWLMLAGTVLTYALEYKLTTASAWTREIFQPDIYSGTATLVSSAVAAGDYQVRLASICQGNISPWSPIATVTI